MVRWWWMARDAARRAFGFETPVAIDSIEWFASPRDMIGLLDWLRRQGGEALPILAVNPGIASADAKRCCT